MKFSVLMSVYKKENPEYLEKSLDSIINQTIKPNEIVIMQDGVLNNDLKKVIEKYKNNYKELIETYIIEDNKGLGNALNKGVHLCKYEYIARMDSDDIAVQDRFEKQVQFFNNNDVDIVGGFIKEYDEKLQKELSIRKVPLKDEEIKNKMKIISPFNHGTVMFKKKSVLKAGNYSIITLEDYDLWARMTIHKYKMANMDEILCFNRTGKSMYKRRSGKKYVQSIMQIEKMLLLYKIIDKKIYYFNIVLRFFIAKCPIFLKECIYPNVLRKIF